MTAFKERKATSPTGNFHAVPVLQMCSKCCFLWRAENGHDGVKPLEQNGENQQQTEIHLHQGKSDYFLKKLLCCVGGQKKNLLEASDKSRLSAGSERGKLAF